jgi:hypothetical protein
MRDNYSGKLRLCNKHDMFRTSLSIKVSLLNRIVLIVFLQRVWISLKSFILLAQELFQMLLFFNLTDYFFLLYFLGLKLSLRLLNLSLQIFFAN